MSTTQFCCTRPAGVAAVAQHLFHRQRHARAAPAGIPPAARLRQSDGRPDMWLPGSVSRGASLAGGTVRQSQRSAIERSTEVNSRYQFTASTDWGSRTLMAKRGVAVMLATGDRIADKRITSTNTRTYGRRATESQMPSRRIDTGHVLSSSWLRTSLVITSLRLWSIAPNGRGVLMLGDAFTDSLSVWGRVQLTDFACAHCGGA